MVKNRKKTTNTLFTLTRSKPEFQKDLVNL